MGIKLDLQGKRLAFLIMALVVLVVLSALIGVGIQFAASSGCSTQKDSITSRDDEKARLEQHAKILAAMKADNIKNNLR